MSEQVAISEPHPVDICVGRRLRARRTILRMSQEDLGRAVGVTFQQIQKYERGANRVGSSRLYEFSLVLDVGVDYFFQDCPSELGALRRGNYSGHLSDISLDTDAMALLRAFGAVSDPLLRRRLLSLVRVMAGDNQAEEGSAAKEGEAKKDADPRAVISA
jgi:transcriptional regulator with XRE-family HTH domain